MAKLKAHGAELGRATLERQTPKSELTQWVREERTLMADGKLMEKRTVRFKPSTFDPTGRLHSHGWRLGGKAELGLTVERWAELHQQSGWTVEIFVPDDLRPGPRRLTPTPTLKHGGTGNGATLFTVTL